MQTEWFVDEAIYWNTLQTPTVKVQSEKKDYYDSYLDKGLTGIRF